MSMFNLRNLLDFSYESAETTWSSGKISEIKRSCTPAVVKISLVHVRKVGIEGNASIASATGFVVDAENGLILTNRHVIKNGPVIATATFLHRRQKEKVKLQPLYRDPVHDFGFFKFRPAALDIATEPLKEIPLCPQKAVKNACVLIVGVQRGALAFQENATLLEVDVNPVAGMDFNTFMITGDDQTLPGYSGGPILNAKGEAVAMVSTTLKETNLSYHIPLHMCAYALQFLRNSQPVPRGSIQTVCTFTQGTQINALAKSNVHLAAFLQEQQLKKEEGEEEKEAEEEEGEVGKSVDVEVGDIGLLEVDLVLAGGPGDVAGLKKGDILLSIDKEPVLNFVQMEGRLDAAVGRTVEVVVCRGEELVRLECDVQDFNALDPTEYIEVSNAIVHEVEFITAVVYNLPLEGIFLAQPGYMFKDVVPEMSIIVSIGENPTRTLDEFQEAIDRYSNGSLVRVQYFLPSDPERVNFRMLQVEKQWFPYNRGRQDPLSGEWDLTDLSHHSGHARGEAAETRVSVYTAMTYDSDGLAEDFHPRVQASVRKERGIFGGAFRGLSMSFSGANGKFKELHNAVVSIKFTAPFNVDSKVVDEESKGRCVGVVVDKELGLIVTERFTVFTTLGDALVTFNSIVSIAATVVFVHPFHFFSILRYDPAELAGQELVKVNALPLTNTRVQIGESVLYAGLSIKFTRSLDPQAIVGARESLFLSGRPRDESFTPRNLEYFQGTERTIGMGGAYINPSDYTLRGLNMHFVGFRIQGGIQAADIFPYYHLVRDALLQGRRPPKHIPLLGVHLSTKPLVEVLNTCNLPRSWTKRLYNSMDASQHSVLVISKRMLFTPAYDLLQNQDVILSVNGNVTTNATEFNEQVMGCRDVTLTLIREGEVLDIADVETSKITSVGTTRVVFLAGLTVQELPPSAFFALDSRDEGVTPTSVYIADVAEGSPGKVGGLKSSWIVLEVNDVGVGSMDEFLDEVVAVANGEELSLRLLIIETGAIITKRVTLDTDYWPTRELLRNGRTLKWRTTELEHGQE